MFYMLIKIRKPLEKVANFIQGYNDKTAAL